jgi:hypothetical protein
VCVFGCWFGWVRVLCVGERLAEEEEERGEGGNDGRTHTHFTHTHGHTHAHTHTHDEAEVCVTASYRESVEGFFFLERAVEHHVGGGVVGEVRLPQHEGMVVAADAPDRDLVERGSVGGAGLLANDLCCGCLGLATRPWHAHTHFHSDPTPLRTVRPTDLEGDGVVDEGRLHHLVVCVWGGV